MKKLKSTPLFSFLLGLCLTPLVASAQVSLNQSQQTSSNLAASQQATTGGTCERSELYECIVTSVEQVEINGKQWCEATIGAPNLLDLKPCSGCAGYTIAMNACNDVLPVAQPMSNLGGKPCTIATMMGDITVIDDKGKKITFSPFTKPRPKIGVTCKSPVKAQQTKIAAEY